MSYSLATSRGINLNMKNAKLVFLIIPLIIISCATKSKDIKKEEIPSAPPVEVAQVSPPQEIKPEEKPPPPISPQPTPEKFVLLNFDDADLRDIITLVSDVTGLNFIIAPGVTAKITIYSTKKIPASELFSIVESILEVNGLAVVKSENFYIIVPKGREPSLINSTRIRIFNPKNVDVRTLSRELMNIINTITFGREGISLIPLERLNELIIFSPNEKFLKTIEEWAKKLDEEIVPRGLTTFVYPVRNVKVKEIAEVLKAIYETKEGVKPATKPATTTTTIAPKSTQTPQTTQKVEVFETRGTGEIKIVVYEPTNSIVILASFADYKQIVETIKMLDVYPRQVLIEVLIAEVTLTDETRFGIQWSLLSQGKANVFGETHTFEGLSQFRHGTSLYSVEESPLPPSISGGLTPATGGYSYLLYEAGRLTAMLHALATEGKVNVLSSPHLLVKDNQEASIDIGSEVPISTGVTQQVTGAQTPLSQSIQYKTVGVKLKMKPVINDEGTVVLDITQEVSEQSTDVNVGGLSYPSFSKREAKTAIVVSHSQSIVIGGIMREISKRDYEGIPLLSKIPLIGNLFRYTVNKNEKTELIILLTPHVIENKIDVDVITQKFKEKVKDLKKPLRKLEKEEEKRKMEKKEKEEEKKDKKEESQPSE